MGHSWNLVRTVTTAAAFGILVGAVGAHGCSGLPDAPHPLPTGPAIAVRVEQQERAGGFEVTDTIERLGGRKPTTFDEFVAEQRPSFQS